MNVLGLTTKELARQITTGSKLRVDANALTVEFVRRNKLRLRNLGRYQKRFKQGAYGVRS